jgi:arylsulfatase A-like enzyme
LKDHPTMNPDARPNFVVLFADDHRYESIGIHGNTEVATPNLDALGRRGVVFDGARCQGGMQGAICVPSRATLMTGRNIFASSAEPTGRDGPASYAIPEDMSTFPELMREAGYRTHAVGKWHNDAASFARSFDGGAQLMFGGMSDHDAVPIRAYDASGAYPDDAISTAEGFSTDLFADAAIRFIEEQEGDQPFLLYVAFTAPHDPRTPPEEWRVDPATVSLPPNALPVHPFDNGDMDNRDENLETWPRQPAALRRHIADYYGMVAHMDDRIGDILAALEARGLADTTVVVYSADHGIGLGQHGLLGKQSRYEHSTHVPLLMAGPGIAAGERVPELVWHGDTTATLLELAGLDQSVAADGRSLAPALRRDPLPEWRETFAGAYAFTQRSVQDRRWKLIVNTINPDYPELRGTRGSDAVQLFDLEADPWERVNLAWDEELAGVRARLEAALLAWQEQAGDPAFASIVTLPSGRMNELR